MYGPLRSIRIEVLPCAQFACCLLVLEKERRVWIMLCSIIRMVYALAAIAFYLLSLSLTVTPFLIILGLNYFIFTSL